MVGILGGDYTNIQPLYIYYRYKIQIFGLKKKKNEGVALSPLNPVAYTVAYSYSYGVLLVLYRYRVYSHTM